MADTQSIKGSASAYGDGGLMADDPVFTTSSVPLTFFSEPERICPKCGPNRAGVLRVSIEPYAGEYCPRCYAEWVQANIPRLEPRT